MTTKTIGVDHGVTIAVQPRVGGIAFTWPWRALCLCGWASPFVPSRAQAKAHADVHDSEATR